MDFKWRSQFFSPPAYRGQTYRISPMWRNKETKLNEKESNEGMDETSNLKVADQFIKRPTHSETAAKKRRQEKAKVESMDLREPARKSS